jgi:peptidoglycan hydrolase-like protein with peptidoglycan-binding domain
LTASSAVTSTTTTVAPAPTEFPTLQLGASGPAVEAAQLLLVDAGADVTPSGFFDHETGDAVTAFDAAHRLPPDGILGPLSWSELVTSVRVGSTGEAVRAAQLLLNTDGADIAEDGLFGPGTEAATLAFERAHGLHQDGIVDIEVWRLLTANAAADP